MYFEVTAFIYICWRQALSCYKADFFSKVVPLPGWIKSNSRKIDCLHSYFFFSGLRFVSHGSRLRRSRAVTLQRKTRDCLQCTGKKLAELWQGRQGRTRPKLCGLCTYQCKSRGGGGGECGQGAGIWCLRLSPCRAFDRAKRPRGPDIWLWPTEAWYQFRSGYQVCPSQLSESHAVGERSEVFICFNRHNPIL